MWVLRGSMESRPPDICKSAKLTAFATGRELPKFTQKETLLADSFGGVVFFSGQLAANRQKAKSEGKKCSSSFRLLIGYLLA
ncbi:hypothetical protein BV372_00235 [Nostoc sp. T09]|nr:hypothetical protein BV372_00235 [Nostoc sp. T09]